MKKVHPERRTTGVVQLDASGFRTLMGGQFQAGRKHRIEIDHLLSDDVLTIQAVTEPLRYLFPAMGWDEWGIEIVSGHDRVAEVLLEEQTILLEQRALDTRSVLGWELFGAFVQAVLEDEFDAYLAPEDIPLLGLVLQLTWFAGEGEEWQREILTFVADHGSGEDELAPMLWELLSDERADALRELMGLPLPSGLDEDGEEERERIRDVTGADMTHQEQIWAAALAFCQLARDPRTEVAPGKREHSAFLRAFSICSLLPWEAICSPLPGLLGRFFFEIPVDASSTDRRLGLFRIAVEMGMRADELVLDPMVWPRMSALVLDPDRHPKIYQALLQFLEMTHERERRALWPIASDETLLAQLALQNQLSEQDDRFFRQATHIQAIWRDILHRSASQPWASQLLFDQIERVVAIIEAEPDLLFAAVIWNRAMWEAGTPIAPPLQNLRELLWILSQSPLAVLRRLYPEDAEESAAAHERWPLLVKHLKRFLHLAPQILSRLCDQLEEEQGRPATQDPRNSQFEVDADPDIPQQELHGRILPLLARPDIKRYRHIQLEEAISLRVLHLDRYLHQSSGLWKEHRFFSSFLLFFKTEQDQEEGGWSELALWIDKDLDLGKVVNKKGLSSTIRGLLLEDGIWERTYRYQFLTVQQLMAKLNPDAGEWGQLLQLLGSEYTALLEQRLRELLDYQYYVVRSQHLRENALTGAIEDDSANLHFFWRLPVEEFESVKPSIAARITEEILDEFYRAHLQDDRNWSHAHQAIAQRVKDISALLQLAPGTLPTPGDSASALHQLCGTVIGQWVDAPEHFASIPQSPLSWSEDKKALIQRLDQMHHDGARAFVGFLIQQFQRKYRVVELLMDRPLEDEGTPVIFKPIPTSSESAERQREFVPFLRDPDGQLLSPAFLELFAHIPPSWLRTVVTDRPTLFKPLQRVAHLLRELDSEGEHTTKLWEILEELREVHRAAMDAQETPKAPEETAPEEPVAQTPEPPLTSHNPETGQPSDVTD